MQYVFIVGVTAKMNTFVGFDGWGRMNVLAKNNLNPKKKNKRMRKT